MKKKIGIALLVLILGLVGLNFLAPATLYSGIQSATRFAAGWEIKTVDVNGHAITYADNGNTDKPALLLVHGFTADKDTWAQMGILLRDYHVISIDLLGHGDSPRKMDIDYKVSSQVAMIRQFAKNIGLDTFHIAGNSMGGYIATMYTVMYPEQIISTTLFNAAGVKMPTPSKMETTIRNGEPHPLIMRGAEDAENYFGYVFEKQPPLTGSIKKQYARDSAQHEKLYHKIFGDFHPNMDYVEPLEPILSAIKTPVLIVWGDSDRVLDPSMMSVLKAGIPHAQTVTMKGIGHVPMLEDPLKSAQVLKDFIGSVK